MIRDISIGKIQFKQGKPLICVPVSGSSTEEVVWEIEHIGAECDIIEWRADFFCEDFLSGLKAVKSAAGDIPVLVTYRTTAEGGKGKATEKEYYNIIKGFIGSRKTDLIDIEFNRENSKELLEMAKQHSVVSVLSSHSFTSTGTKEEIKELLCNMEQAGGDIPKIAQMPNSFEDVMSLMSATMEVSKENFPIITISMGRLGKVSRLCGEFTGSSVTFGSGMLASAPGQIKNKLLNEFLNELHK